MPKSQSLSVVLCLTFLAALATHAQAPATPPAAPTIIGTPLSPELARRVEVLVRQKANLPPGAVVHVGPRMPSDVQGFDMVPVTITEEGKNSNPIKFLLSPDGKTLAQFTRYDISADPRNMVSADGRPARGGPETAPVLIVGFDDLECPYCARLHATIFPAITTRYGGLVRIVYRDFPLDQHPWAMHAAVDVNCLAAQSPTGYWNVVDTIHAHASEISSSNETKPENQLFHAEEQIDRLTLEQGKLQQVDISKLSVCIKVQDTKAIEDSVKLATSLGVDSTPILFINGAKIDGALPIEFIFDRIDDALRAEGKIPPAPYAPAPVTSPAPTIVPKPGS